MMNIEYITHASLLLRSANFSLLTDPCYFLEPFFATNLFHFPPRIITLEIFSKLNYIYSSHIHIDHSHPQTLRQIKNQVETVILPSQRPDLEKRYRDIGYDQIRLLENGQTVKLNDSLEVTSYWDDPVDTVLLIKVADKVILHQNDCRLTTRTLSKIADNFKIDYAFLLYTNFANHQPTLSYRSPEDISRQVAEDEEKFLQSQIDVIKILQPKTIIPYSMTLTYCQPEQIHLNGYNRMTPTIFKNKLLNHLPAAKCWIMQPGDIIDLELDSWQYFNHKNLWGETLDEYLHNITDYIDKESIPKFDFGDPQAYHEKTIRHLTRRFAVVPPIFINKVIAFEVIGNNDSICYRIDCEKATVYIDNLHFHETSNNYFIKLSIPASMVEKMIDDDSCESILEFMLYSNRVLFKVNCEQNLSVKAQFGLLIKVLLFIFGGQDTPQ